MVERRRPSHTVIVPGRDRLDAVLEAMITTGQTFTVEPVDTHPDLWHVGLLPEGVEVLAQLMGPITQIHLDDRT